jgi:hypothetical protein
LFFPVLAVIVADLGRSLTEGRDAFGLFPPEHLVDRGCNQRAVWRCIEQQNERGMMAVLSV